MTRSGLLKRTVLVLCGLSFAVWVFRIYTLRSNKLPAVKQEELKEPRKNSYSFEGPIGIQINDAIRKDIRTKLLAKQTPWVPVDVATLDKNFKSLKLVTTFYNGHKSRMDELMKHKVPVISTTNWRLHTPSGRVLSIESIQRSLLSGSEGYPVPNAAHFILPFRDSTIQFHHMVSILSCIHVMKPQLLFLWYAPGRMARGKWWARLRNNLTESEWEKRIVMATRPLPDQIYTMHVVEAEHKSDIMRMEALLMFGGAYFDIDVVVLKPLTYLRRFPFSIGREVPDGLCNGVFLSAPNSTFLAMWHTAYQVFDGTAWGEYSVLLPHQLHRKFPELCHVEETSMDRPNWTAEEVQLIYGIGRKYDWDWRVKNYVLHLWFRMYKIQHDMNSIKSLNSMYGEVCRFILYGTSDML